MLRDYEQNNQNLKIFILKLLVNNQELFKPFSINWIKPICDFIVSKNTGGKGFHYFLRDLTTLLILWSESINPVDLQPKLCSKVLNTLVRLAADKSKIIFNINIELIAMLLHKWRTVVTLDKEMLVKMMSVPDSQEGSHLWKMTAIQMIALACTFNLPIRNDQSQD